MAKAKLTGFQPALNQQGQQKTWQGQNGLTYYFNVQLSDGTAGEAGSTKAQPSWKIGEEYTFEVETNQYGTKIKGLKKADSFPSKSYGGGGESPDRQRAIIAQSSVSTAATFYASRGQASEDDVLKFAGRIFNFVMSKVESPQPTPQAPPVQQQPVNNIYQQPQDSSDDLPW